MNRATLPPTAASRLQARLTRNTQMHPSLQIPGLARLASMFWISSPA